MNGKEVKIISVSYSKLYTKEEFLKKVENNYLNYLNSYFGENGVYQTFYQNATMDLKDLKIKVKKLLKTHKQVGLKDPQAAMTMSFLVLSISQIILSFNQRSNIDSIFSPKDHNKWLYIVSFGALGVVAFIAYTSKVMDIFQLVYLEPINYLYVLLISLVPLVLVEIQKLIRRFYLKHKK